MSEIPDFSPTEALEGGETAADFNRLSIARAAQAFDPEYVECPTCDLQRNHDGPCVVAPRPLPTQTSNEKSMSVWQPNDPCASCNHLARPHRRPVSPFGSMPCSNPKCECSDWRGR